MIYSDIKLENDDLAINGTQTGIIEDRDVVKQDIMTALRISGLLVLLVGERNTSARKVTETLIINLVEDDLRVVPGSVTFLREKSGYMLAGKTYEFGDFMENISL